MVSRAAYGVVHRGSTEAGPPRLAAARRAGRDRHQDLPLPGWAGSPENLDGTNVRLTVRSGQVVRVDERRDPSKAPKAQGIVFHHPDGRRAKIKRKDFARAG